jgi:AcrR family transcriptional regulator
MHNEMPAKRRNDPAARDRMIASTALLVRERGASATSIDDVLEHSGAPRGSVYHHFPGGREQLLREATGFAGGFVADRLERAAADGPLAVLDEIVRVYGRALRDSDFRAGCPVVAVAVETGPDAPDLSREAREAFNSWRVLLARACTRAGIDAGRADELAVIAIAAVEGAIILSRAYRSLDPLQMVASELRDRIVAALPAA